MKDLIERIIAAHPQINTPALIVCKNRLQQNIRAMQQLSDKNQKQLRPHIKTHKSVWIAKQQLQAGAVGVTAAKLSEAEVMAEGGISDIFVANEITHPRKLRKLRQLHDSCRIAVGLDHLQQVYLYGAHFTDADHPLDVLIEVDSGLQRCGVRVGSDLISLAQAVKAQPGLHLQGIFTHAGQVYATLSRQEIIEIGEQEGKIMERAVQLLRSSHITIETVSVGSTPTAEQVVKNPVVTEIRPGNYVFYDAIQIAMGTCLIENCALFVLATVISQPEAHRIIIDAGSKALHLDQGAHAVKMLEGFGTNLNVEGSIVRVSEEHGMIDLSNPQEIPLGSAAVILPNHACAVVNLYDYYYLLDNDGSFELLNIDARGRSQ
jgi:D-serine deaminase-like pyridoxal phosphate-dependent protein